MREGAAKGSRDFDDHQAELKTLTAYAGEWWLGDVPTPALPLSADDREAVARWLYPVDDWLTREFLERLP